MSNQKYTPFNKGGHKYNYETMSLIGTGAYGKVYKAQDLENPGHMVAIKTVRVGLTDDGVPNSTLREVAILKQLNLSNHPNVVKLLDVCNVGPRKEHDNHFSLYLVFEHLEQDLSNYIEKLNSRHMSKFKIQQFARELLTGIDFLHTHRIIHRDLKPQNLLVSTSGHLKLADFGLAKTFDFEMKLTSVVVTLWYRAPEVLLSQSYYSAVDIWSAGCIIAELFSKKPLFPGQSESDQLSRILELTGLPSAEDWPQETSISRSNFPPHERKEPHMFCHRICNNSNDMLSMMLDFDQTKRPSALDCLNHAYFIEELLSS